jgi:hypothetical protein
MLHNIANLYVVLLITQFADVSIAICQINERILSFRLEFNKLISYELFWYFSSINALAVSKPINVISVICQ